MAKVTKPGKSPRAITNGGSATMRQIKAKAVQKRRMAEGKSTKASRSPGLSQERMDRVRSLSKSQRVIGDSGQVRAAQAAGRKAVAQAQARRGAKQAMKAMEGTLRTARTVRNVVGAAKNLARGGAAAAGLQAYNTADGTLTAAKKKGLVKPQQKAGPAVPKRLSSQGVNKMSFDDAFRNARKSGAKVFTWRGKKYTTEMK